MAFIFMTGAYVCSSRLGQLLASCLGQEGAAGWNPADGQAAAGLVDVGGEVVAEDLLTVDTPAKEADGVVVGLDIMKTNTFFITINFE
jgi:hypothetical protein